MSRYLRSANATRVSAAAFTVLACAASLIVSAAPASAADRIRPFRAQLTGYFSGHDCSPKAPAGALCIADEVSGIATGMGRVTGRFEVVIDLAAFGSDGCGPIHKRGRLAAANGDRLRLAASGRFCFANSIADYLYWVTGGTGRFAGATGGGAWHVPAPTVFDPATTSGYGEEQLLGVLTGRE